MNKSRPENPVPKAKAYLETLKVKTRMEKVAFLRQINIRKWFIFTSIMSLSWMNFSSIKSPIVQQTTRERTRSKKPGKKLRVYKSQSRLALRQSHYVIFCHFYRVQYQEGTGIKKLDKT